MPPEPDAVTEYCFQHDESVVVEELDEDVCLYRAETDDVAVLNRTAGDIWALIDGSTPVGEITSILATAYQTTPEQLSADVERVIDDLARRGFVRAVSAG